MFENPLEQVRTLDMQRSESRVSTALSGAEGNQANGEGSRVSDVTRSRMAGSDPREQVRNLDMRVRNVKFRPHYYIAGGGQACGGCCQARCRKLECSRFDTSRAGSKPREQVRKLKFRLRYLSCWRQPRL